MSQGIEFNRLLLEMRSMQMEAMAKANPAGISSYMTLQGLRLFMQAHPLARVLIFSGTVEKEESPSKAKENSLR